MAKKKFARECTACGKGMNEGYCIESGMEYYCSDACLHTEITPEEWLELYNDGEGDSYWTDWSEDPDNFEDEDEMPSPEAETKQFCVMVKVWVCAENEADAKELASDEMSFLCTADTPVAAFDVVSGYDMNEQERLRAGLRHAVELIEDIGLDASIERAALRQEV